MNCVIIEDIETCEALQKFIMNSGSVKLAGTSNDPVTGITQFAGGKDIDLLFLNFDMLKKDTIDLISNLEHKPFIILLSSTDQYASKVFDFNVIDYLLKPVTYERFFKAIDKAARYYVRKEPVSLDDSIFIKRDSSLVKLDFKDILYIEALENYVVLNTKSEKFTIHFTMKAIEDHLPSDIFIRIHRSFIVNKKMIKAIHSNSLEVEFKEKSRTLPIGNSYRDSLFRNIIILER